MADKCGPCLTAQSVNAPRGGQDPLHPGFVRGGSRFDRYDCEQCIGWHAANHGFPVLGTENVASWELYQQLQGQQRVGMDVIGLDFGMLEGMFNILRIPLGERELYWRKLVVIDQAIMEQRQRKRAQEANRKEADRRLQRMG